MFLVICDLLVPITHQIRLRSSYRDSRSGSDFLHNFFTKKNPHDLKMV
jgi:hypothetical protein